MVLLVTPQTAAAPSEEARILDLLQQGAFDEVRAHLEKQPVNSPLRLSLDKPVRRLIRIREQLLGAINAGAAKVDLKEVHPPAQRGGRIVGAGEGFLKVEDQGRERRLIWSGLPSTVTLELARRFLRKESATDRSLLLDLAEALGLVDELRGMNPDRADAAERVRAVRTAIARRSVMDAREALGDRAPKAGETPWLALGRRWVDRLESASRDRLERRATFEKTLPKGTALHLWDDFEEGPELVSPVWNRGWTHPAPDSAGTPNRCRKSIFIGKNLGWGELADHCHAVESLTDRQPFCTLEDNLYLSLRVWPVNVQRLDIALINLPHEGDDRYSILEVPLQTPEAWNRVKVRLDDISRHKPWRVNTSFPVLRMGDPIWRMRFTAFRADKSKEDGVLFLDDVRLYRLPAGQSDDRD